MENRDNNEIKSKHQQRTDVQWTLKKKKKKKKRKIEKEKGKGKKEKHPHLEVIVKR